MTDTAMIRKVDKMNQDMHSIKCSMKEISQSMKDIRDVLMDIRNVIVLTSVSGVEDGSDE